MKMTEKGVYVSFWLFDTDADASIRFRATTTKVWSDSNYDYTETSHYMVHRGGSIGFNQVPVDGSSKMADDLMESIEPFDFSEAVPFQTAYLAGYMADKYDISAEESVERANERVKHSTEEDMGTGFVSEYPRLMDTADLLSDADEQKLLDALDEVSERQKLDVAIITTDTLEGSDIVSFADDMYDYCQFGYGMDRDGVLLLISIEDHDWYMSTCGYGITAFTDAGIQYIGKQMKSDLSSGNYAAAFQCFIQNCDEFITQSRDLFLYRTVSRTERSKDKDSGSSTHTSSSGTTHGGGGGKF